MALGGWEFLVIHPEIDEQPQEAELPGDYVRRLAMEKAKAALNLVSPSTSDNIIIIAADTSVVDTLRKDAPMRDEVQSLKHDKTLCEVQILGKPLDAVDADRMLQQLRGRTHQVYSSIAVLRSRDGALFSDVCVTEVKMRNYSDEEIREYIASGDAFDKAGAYAIQHPTFRPVEEIKGCYTNVMGLPLCHLKRALASFGVISGTDIARICQEEMGYTCLISQMVLEDRIGDLMVEQDNDEISR